jgi:anti-sigma factor NepR-like protein
MGSLAFPARGLVMNGTRKNANAMPDQAAPDRKAVEAIGRALEAHYTDLVQAPLPEKFVELLARLEGGNRGSEPKERGDANGKL